VTPTLTPMTLNTPTHTHQGQDDQGHERSRNQSRCVDIVVACLFEREEVGQYDCSDEEVGCSDEEGWKVASLCM
jgi:hypothetical protein